MMKKFVYTFLYGLMLCLALSGCGGPSEEKIAQAQDAYSQLVQIHNQVVEAYKDIDDSSLNDQLAALSEKTAGIKTMNLSEMDDETIDSLIGTIHSAITSYEEHLQTIERIKKQEENAVLTPVPFSLTNAAGQTFQRLFLYEKNDLSAKADVLEDTPGFSPGQTLVGLTVYRDVSNTPWILELEDADGISYELELAVKDFDEDGEDFILSSDPETQKLEVSN